MTSIELAYKLDLYGTQDDYNTGEKGMNLIRTTFIFC